MTSIKNIPKHESMVIIKKRFKAVNPEDADTISAIDLKFEKEKDVPAIKCVSYSEYGLHDVCSAK